MFAFAFSLAFLWLAQTLPHSLSLSYSLFSAPNPSWRDRSCISKLERAKRGAGRPLSVGVGSPNSLARWIERAREKERERERRGKPLVFEDRQTGPRGAQVGWTLCGPTQAAASGSSAKEHLPGECVCVCKSGALLLKSARRQEARKSELAPASLDGAQASGRI